MADHSPKQAKKRTKQAKGIAKGEIIVSGGKLAAKFKPTDYGTWTTERRRAWSELSANPDKYYLHFPSPGLSSNGRTGAGGDRGDKGDRGGTKDTAKGAHQQVSGGGPQHWSAADEVLFRHLIAVRPPQNGLWGLFSMHMPGRTGIECRGRHHPLPPTICIALFSFAMYIAVFRYSFSSFFFFFFFFVVLKC